jgi:hypothetical protein
MKKWEDLSDRKRFVIDVAVKFALIYISIITARAIL